MRSRATLLLLLLLSAALAIYLWPRAMLEGQLLVRPALASGGELREFTVVVSRFGFNGSSGPLTLEVLQGDTVRITFVYGDGDLPGDNPHVIMIEGYNVQTGLLSKTNPRQVVEFTAGQAGSFAFRCVIPCIGMENLQLGEVKVHASGAGLPTAIRDVRVSLQGVKGEGYELSLKARLVDAKGQPIAGAIIEVYLSTTFGPLKVGSNVTGPDGSFQLTYELSPGRRAQLLLSFPGSGAYLPSSASAAFEPPQAGAIALETPYVRGQARLPDLRLVGVEPRTSAVLVALAVGVVGSVWLLFLYVIWLTIRLRRAGEGARASEEGG